MLTLTPLAQFGRDPVNKEPPYFRGVTVSQLRIVTSAFPTQGEREVRERGMEQQQPLTNLKAVCARLHCAH